MFFDIHAHVYNTPIRFGRNQLFLTPEERLAKKMSCILRSVLPIVSSEEYMPQSVGE